MMLIPVLGSETSLGRLKTPTEPYQLPFTSLLISVIVISPDLLVDTLPMLNSFVV